MPDDEKQIETDWIRVRSGHRLMRAKRLSTGNWRLEGDDGYYYGTVNNGDFQAHYEKVPAEYQEPPPEAA
jgi:hypothetical protein